MINILQNVTRVNFIRELKRLAIGVAISVPLIAAYFFLDFLVDRAILNKEVVGNVLMLSSLGFMFWAVGGAYESYREMKRMQTDEAFRKLGLKD